MNCVNPWGKKTKQVTGSNALKVCREDAPQSANKRGRRVLIVSDQSTWFCLDNSNAVPPAN